MDKLQIPPNSYFFKKIAGHIKFRSNSHVEFEDIRAFIKGDSLNAKDNAIYRKRLISTCACYEWVNNKKRPRMEKIIPILLAWQEWGGLNNV